MRKIETEVLIVGAGPAGSMTARYAAKGGADVLMIEKRQEIGSPVRCAEGISQILLDKVDLKLEAKDIAKRVVGAKIYSPSGHVVTVSEKHAGNEVGLVLDRVFFDKHLAKMAVKEGSDLMLKTAATGLIMENGKVSGVKATSPDGDLEIRAKCVVGADGYESQVGRWAGIDTKLSTADITSCIQYRLTNIDYDSDYCHFYVGSIAPGGYIWIFPKEDDTANVGMGIQLKQLKHPAQIKRTMDKFIAGQPGLAKGKPLDIVSGAVSICAPIDRTVIDNLLLVGDSARQIDPITGGGISNGCIAGKIAGEALAKAHEAKDFSEKTLQRYEKGWRDEMENKLYRNWMAKEKLITLSDDTFDKIISTLAEVGIEKVSTLAILQAIEKKYPDLVKEFRKLL